MKKTLPTLRIMMLKSCRLLLCLSVCDTITQTKEIFNHYLSASLKWGQISKAWFCRSSWCIYSRRSCITWGCLHSCSSCSRCCVASPWPRVPGRSVTNSTHVVFRLNAGEQLCSCELLIATQSGWTWSEELWHCAAGHWSLWRWKPILPMCAEVHRFFTNCEELSDLSLARDAGRCFEEAISVREFGLLSVIQVLQPCLMGRTGECSLRQWSLVGSRDHGQSLPRPPRYKKATRAQKLERVSINLCIKSTFNPKYHSVLLLLDFFCLCSHQINKRKCNTATCVTQRLADFLVRSSNTIGTVYAPTNVGSATYGKRDLPQPPSYLPL